MPNVDFAARVRRIRQARRETQEEFAWDLDVSVGTMNGRENRKRRPVKAQRRPLISLAEGMEFAILKLIATAGRGRARKVIETGARPSNC
jgi:transcriptional regulator with XRE-family HTH domain